MHRFYCGLCLVKKIKQTTDKAFARQKSKEIEKEIEELEMSVCKIIATEKRLFEAKKRQDGNESA